MLKVLFMHCLCIHCYTWWIGCAGGCSCADCCPTFCATSSEWEGGVDVLPVHV